MNISISMFEKRLLPETCTLPVPRNGIIKQLYRKIHYLTREFHVKFHAKNRYRTNLEAMSAISVFQVQFNVEFTSQVIDFP